MTLNPFLKKYGLRLTHVITISAQSPATLRNWYENKPSLIVCLIASHKWRTFNSLPIIGEVEFSDSRRTTLGKYLSEYNVTLEEICWMSEQSSETLRNWFLAPTKFMLIDILIHAVLWRKKSIDNQLIHPYATHHDFLKTFEKPTFKKLKNEDFALNKFIKKKTLKTILNFDKGNVDE